MNTQLKKVLIKVIPFCATLLLFVMVSPMFAFAVTATLSGPTYTGESMSTTLTTDMTDQTYEDNPIIQWGTSSNPSNFTNQKQMDPDPSGQIAKWTTELTPSDNNIDCGVTYHYVATIFILVPGGTDTMTTSPVQTFNLPCEDSPSTFTYVVVATPLPQDPGSETGTITVDLSIEPTNDSAIVRYTTMGQTATCVVDEGYQEFVNPIAISTTTTISTIACDPNTNEPISSEVEFTYDFGEGTEDSPNTDTQVHLVNPIGVNTIQDFVKKLLDIVLTIGIPIVALAIIYAGFLFVSARGNTEKLETAKETLLYTIIGGAILLGSWVLASAISATITSFQ